MARKRMLNTFREAKNAGPYGEYPVLSDDVDPQFFLSQNDRQQPFFLTCEKDTVLVQMSGASTIEFLDSSVNFFRAVPGDFVYVPGGTPHRINPDGSCVQYRIKANKSGLEAVSFHCPSCGAELLQDTWETSSMLPQEAYLRAVSTFNRDDRVRVCVSCGTAHPVIDLGGYRWQAIIDELKASDGAEAW